MEAAKGVIWNHGEVKIGLTRAHKYVVGFVLVTDTPLPQAATGSHTCHMGGGPNNLITQALLQTMRSFPALYALGNLSNAVMTVAEWDPNELLRVGKERAEDAMGREAPEEKKTPKRSRKRGKPPC